MRNTGKSKNTIQNTKKNIIEIARGLFSEFGYLGVSMEDIAKKLNITKAALYYHFSSKREIYKKVLDEVFKNLTRTIAQALKENTVDKKLQKLIKNYLSFNLKEKNLIRALMLKLPPKENELTKHILQLRKQIINLIQPLIEEITIKKRINKKIDSKLLASILLGIMDGLVLEYSFLNKKLNLSKISKEIFAILFNYG